MHLAVDKLKKVIDSLADGTIIPRLKSKWMTTRRKRLERTWAIESKRRVFLDTHIQKGVSMRLYTDSALSRAIFRGNFELLERQFVNRFLKSGDNFVDAGANVGLFTLIAARCIGPHGSVHSFEPCRRTWQRLQENVSLNGFTNVTAHQVALSESRSRVPLYVSTNGADALNSLGQGMLNSQATHEMVNTETLDHFAESSGLADRLVLIKIDVEGWETFAIRGGTHLLNRPATPTLIVEFNERTLRAANSSCVDLYGALTDLGYKLYSFDGLTPQLACTQLSGNSTSVNLIATKNLDVLKRRLAA
jgi:FkbM family methyltransferase